MSDTRAVTRPAPYGRVLISGAVFGVISMVPATVVYWLLRLVGVDFEVQPPGQPVSQVAWWQVLATCLLAGVLGAALAGTFRTLYSGPRIAALVLGALTVASCAMPLSSGLTAATRWSLVALHLIVGGIITWAVSRAITSEDPPPGVVEELDSRHPGAGSGATYST